MPSTLPVKRIIVAFSGVDGSGKTTQAKLLAEEFEKTHGPEAVAYSHGNRPLFQKDVKAKASQQYAKKRSWLMSVLILKKDILKLWLFLFRHRRRSVIIFDRYIDDALAKFCFYQGSVAWIERLARRMVPRADQVIWLDVPAEVSQERDREHPLEYHEKKRTCYAGIIANTPGDRLLKIDGTGTVADIQSAIGSRMHEAGWL